MFLWSGRGARVRDRATGGPELLGQVQNPRAKTDRAPSPASLIRSGRAGHAFGAHEPGPGRREDRASTVAQFRSEAVAAALVALHHPGGGVVPRRHGASAAYRAVPRTSIAPAPRIELCPAPPSRRRSPLPSHGQSHGRPHGRPHVGATPGVREALVCLLRLAGQRRSGGLSAAPDPVARTNCTKRCSSWLAAELSRTRSRENSS